MDDSKPIYQKIFSVSRQWKVESDFGRKAPRLLALSSLHKEIKTKEMVSLVY